MDRLDELESRSIYIIREAYHRFRKIAMLWSIGKDSTSLLALCRQAFFGKLPFPVVHIDTGYKFKKMYEMRDSLAKEWGLQLIVGRNEEAIASGMGPNKGQKLDCCTELKTNALKKTIAKHGFRALLLGIRRDEHGIRAKERYFSPRDESFKWNYRDQPLELWDQHSSREEKGTHFRVHPLLHWTELDIWQYTQREKLPYTDLYTAKEGKRYRSIGCECCCSPIESNATNVEEIIAELASSKTGERDGRAQDKESVYTMQKLRAMGYM